MRKVPIHFPKSNNKNKIRVSLCVPSALCCGKEKSVRREEATEKNEEKSEKEKYLQICCLTV
jgi:hypothetical protein